MIETSFNHFVKKYNFRLIFLVLIGIFNSEPGFAPNYWNENFVQVTRVAYMNFILITAVVYHYSFGPNSEHAFLDLCEIEASVDKTTYFHLMDIRARYQVKKGVTVIYLKNKLENGLIFFVNSINAPPSGKLWPDHLKRNILVKVPNDGIKAVISLKWSLDEEFKDVRYIRISGKWQTYCLSEHHFDDIEYDLTIPYQVALKSNTTATIRKKLEKDTVNILKDSESVVIKGAELGANIKVYNTAGVELQSTVSKSEAVNIKLPAKQIYIVHIGKSRYKVAM